MTKVKNTCGTSRYNAPAGYSSWLEYWEKKSGRTARRCSAIDCNVTGRANLVGAHVKKVDGGDNHSYIVPLCKACNSRTDEFYVDEVLIPLPSNW
ncbi:hypothetical protein H6B13_16175 [Bacteroides gallinaceum]|uniref:hypothetical protein n=1 Tax=Bacteroides gallinaceum TaxID=1462571 RepID=UPI00195F1A69|nr:hypothetical protein [Bacteroides gallinaceum]MBM6721152.1 hypothetical protein [Bacteroides gallinaceum]